MTCMTDGAPVTFWIRGKKYVFESEDWYEYDRELSEQLMGISLYEGMGVLWTK